jgi:arylsulfatase A-like enzyme
MDHPSIRAIKGGRSWTRRELLGQLGKGIAAAAFARPVLWEPSRSFIQPSPHRKPNIILILADDMGYADFGLQGCADIPTPHIDSLGINGVRLTNGYISCPICAPTRAGLMSGRYQQRFGFETNPGPEAYADEKFGLPRSEITLAERLKSVGYVTGMVGKWHLGYKPELQPTGRGFDEFFGFLSGASDYLPDKRRGASRNPILRNSREVQEREYLTDAFGREAVAFIERHHDTPFFLYLAFNAVHAPLEASEKYVQRFAGIKDSRRRTFAAMLSAMDDNIGRVLEALHRQELDERTLIFFLSDNGGPTPQTTASNAPLRGTKGQVLEGGIRVPFLVQWKGHLPGGKVDHRPVIQLDIAPTVLAAAETGAPPSAGVSPESTASPAFDGVNLLPFLNGEKSGPPHDTLYWRFNDQQAIRRGDWKLVRTRPDPKPRLYNLANDIGEATDLADKEPAKAKELNNIWSEWNAQLMDPQWQRQDGRTRGPAKAAERETRPGAGLEERFRQYDKNGDGKLTPEEFPRASTFKQIDKNNDGVVTLDEAKKFFRSRRGRDKK